MLNSFLPIDPDSHFSIQNLPYGIFSTATNPQKRVGVAIGNWVLDTAVLQTHNLLSPPVFNQPTLNPFMALGRRAWQETRTIIQTLLSADCPTLRDNNTLRTEALLPMRAVTLHMPAHIGDYTDFYSSKQHATNVGMMFRDPQNALLPNWHHLPVAYHGRSSSIVLSGTDIKRPSGQILANGADTPHFAPTQELDYELEVGFFTGSGNQLGQPIPIAQAEEHIFGMVLVNDWSARDIQRWEYRPLGPFLAKNFATSISPWVVTLDALAPFRCPAQTQEPTPLPYLQIKNETFDIQLELSLQTEKGKRPYPLVHSNYKHLYWSIAQQLAHHTSSGCNIRPGDLLASGTISGNTPKSFGSLLEQSWKGTTPIQLPHSEQRTFLQDGDTVTITGYAQGDGYRVGFGDVTGKIIAS